MATQAKVLDYCMIICHITSNHYKKVKSIGAKTDWLAVDLLGNHLPVPCRFKCLPHIIWHVFPTYRQYICQIGNFFMPLLSIMFGPLSLIVDSGSSTISAQLAMWPVMRVNNGQPLFRSVYVRASCRDLPHSFFDELIDLLRLRNLH